MRSQNSKYGICKRIGSMAWPTVSSRPFLQDRKLGDESGLVHCDGIPVLEKDQAGVREAMKA